MTRFPHRSLFALCALLATPATVVAAGPGAIEGVVVDARGAVHGQGDKLFVADGSIMATPLGVNPALTIAAPRATTPGPM